MTHSNRTGTKPFGAADAQPAAAGYRSSSAAGLDADSGPSAPRIESGTDAVVRERAGKGSFADQVQQLLGTQQLGHEIRAFAQVGSTNSVAAEWITSGAPHGAVVLADHQTRGRGRMGRSWLAAPGVNLTFSIILRPELPSDRFGMMIVAACVGVARCIDRFADPLLSAIKWPNDIYLNERKVCGMLLEASWNAPGTQPAVVLGVGLNVNQEEFPEEISERASSLLLETGRIIPRAELLAAVLLDLEEALAQLSLDDDVVRRRYVSRMTGLGERVALRFASSDRFVEGTIRGIDDSGGIAIDTDSGLRVFHAGEVTPSDSR